MSECVNFSRLQIRLLFYRFLINKVIIKYQSCSISRKKSSLSDEKYVFATTLDNGVLGKNPMRTKSQRKKIPGNKSHEEKTHDKKPNLT